MKVIYQKVSEITGQPEDKVQYVVEHTWKSIQRAFKEDIYSRIIFTGLMSFTLNHKQIKGIIWRQIKALRKDRTNKNAERMLKRAWQIKQKYYVKKK